MKPSELFDAIFDLVETPIDSFDAHEATAKESAVARSATTSAIERAHELRKALEELHPGVLAVKLNQYEHHLVNRMAEIRRRESRLVAQTTTPPHVAELTRDIIESQHREKSLVAQTRLVPSGMLGDPSMPASTGAAILPTKFIRSDAIEHFRREIDEAEAEIAKLEKQYRGPTVSPGGAVRDRLSELRAIVAAWPQTERAARLGEEVWMERRKRQHMVDERDALLTKHREGVLTSV